MEKNLRKLFRKLFKKRFSPIIILLLIILYVVFTYFIKQTDTAIVARVIDGDTIETTTGECIRLIGIDTPESVHPDDYKNTEYGKSASEYTSEHLAGKLVKLEYDVERTDKYGRTLAYVWLGDEMFNERLLREGMAKVMTVQPNTKYAIKFEMIESEARKNKAGFWKTYFAKP